MYLNLTEARVYKKYRSFAMNATEIGNKNVLIAADSPRTVASIFQVVAKLG